MTGGAQSTRVTQPGKAQIIGLVLVVLATFHHVVRYLVAMTGYHVRPLWVFNMPRPSGWIISEWVTEASAIVLCVTLLVMVIITAATRRGFGVCAIFALGIAVINLVGSASVLVVASRYHAIHQVLDSVQWPLSIWPTMGPIPLFLVGGMLMLVAPRRTTGGALSQEAATAAQRPFGQLQGQFFLQINAVEYGPYTAAQIAAFADEGRVVPTTMIRPANGYYEPAGVAPGLFGGTQ